MVFVAPLAQAGCAPPREDRRPVPHRWWPAVKASAHGAQSALDAMSGWGSQSALGSMCGRGSRLKRRLTYAAGRVLHESGAFRSLQRLTLPEAVSIAMYHGLTEQPLPVRDWCFTSAASFSQQMEYLARYFDVMHLEEALSPSRPPAKRPVACITFDEGFAGVHDYALPVLERLGLPATVYLVTDLVDSGETVWSARLHQAITDTRAGRVTLGQRRFALDDGHTRESASAKLQLLLKALPRGPFEAALADVLEQLGFDGPRQVPPRPAFAILSSTQIARMSRDDVVRFGGHTATHQILTHTSPERACWEIERSIQAVARWVARPSASFAYPNGGEADFDQEAVTGLRRLGIRYAVTTIEGPNDRHTDPYRLRRYGIVADDPLARFAGLMHHGRAAMDRLLRRTP